MNPHTCLDLFYGKIDFSNLINGLDQKIIGKEYLFKYPVESASMGIFNHWFSVGEGSLGSVLQSKPCQIVSNV